MKLELHHHYHHEHELCEIVRLLNTVISNQEKIMAKVDDFHARMTEKLGAIATSLTGIETDLVTHTNTIAELRAALGELTPEQEAKLAAVESQADALVTRVAAIDAQSPPAT